MKEPSPTARSCTPGQRAPPWAFTLHRGCSHIPHNVSAHALSSPRGIGILAPAPRCDLRAGGRRTRGRTPTHTLATHRVRTRRARGTLAGSSRSSSLCTTSQQPPPIPKMGGCAAPPPSRTRETSTAGPTTLHDPRHTLTPDLWGGRPPGFFWLFAIRELVSNKPCVILAASWWVSCVGQCRDETR